MLNLPVRQREIVAAMNLYGNKLSGLSYKVSSVH